MIDFPHLIEPGVRATAKEVKDNFSQIIVSTQDIKKDQIEDSSIDTRHYETNAGWKTLTLVQETASLTHSNIISAPYILPRAVAGNTVTGIGGPVIVIASFTITATMPSTTNNCALMPAIYVDDVKKVEAQIAIGADNSVPVRLFYMFIATKGTHKIDVRSDNASVTPANCTVTHRRMHTIAVRV